MVAIIREMSSAHLGILPVMEVYAAVGYYSTMDTYLINVNV